VDVPGLLPKNYLIEWALLFPKIATPILKTVSVFLFGSPLIFCMCAGQQAVVFRPESTPMPEQAESAESGQMVESQNGPANAPVPEWVSRFLNGGIRQLEAQGVLSNHYLFVGRNRGTNLNALYQWAEAFTVAQDFPRLAALRIENRLLAAASLYPDDEYGEFFEAMIKNASDAEYPEAVKEESFWVKWRISGDTMAQAASEEESETVEPENPAERESYEFFVLISIDKIMLQVRIEELLANTQTAVSPTRAQSASINRLRLNFFEGF
jgi:hypothetical protein